MLSIQRKVAEEKRPSSAPVFFCAQKIVIVDSSKKRPSLPQSGDRAKKRKEDIPPGLFLGFQAAGSLVRQTVQQPLLAATEQQDRSSMVAVEAHSSAPMVEVVQAVAAPGSSAVAIKPIEISPDVRPRDKIHFSDLKYSHYCGASRWIDGLSGKKIFSFDNAEIRGESIARKLNLTNVSFKGVVLTGKIFVNVDLRGAVIDCRFLQGTVFTPGSVLIDSTTVLIAPEKLSDKQRLGLGLVKKKQAPKGQRPITAFFGRVPAPSSIPAQLIQDLENHEPVNGGFSRPS